MAIAIKEETPKRLYIERREDTSAQQFLILVPLVLSIFILVVLFGGQWLYSINNFVGAIILALGVFFIVVTGIIGWFIIQSTLKDLKADPQTIAIDLQSNMASGILKDYVTKQRQSWTLDLSQVHSIELSWDDPRFDLWMLDLSMNDGSLVRLLYGDKVDVHLVGRKLEACLRKPLHDNGLLSR